MNTKKRKSNLLLGLVIVIIIILNTTINVQAQNVAITDDESYVPENSAMLDVKALDKGLLIPRLTTSQRTGIASPATGLLVFDSDENAFYYYDGSSWMNISTGQAWTISNDYVYLTSENDRVGIGTTSPNSKLEVKADNSFSDTDTLFAVKDKSGNIVFAVFPDGAKVYVNSGSKGSIGGFAVSGRTTTKAGETEYLTVTPDSTRIYVNEASSKGSIGGFAVSGRTTTKNAVNDYLIVAPDSTRIYVNEASSKGSIGGFAVSGRTTTKGATQKFMDMTKENYFIGHLAGINTTPGFDSIGKYNSFIGYESGRSNVTGRYNTFMGYQTGWDNSGSDNTFIGYKAGKSHLDKGGNVYIGSKAGENATRGEQNVYIGEFSGWSTSTGKQNIFMGVNSGYNNTEGSQNIFLGVEAGNTNQEGNFNVFMGYQAGLTNNADYNTFIGYQSGMQNTTGNNNVFLGYHAGRDNTLGNYNVFLGYRAGLHNVGDGAFQGAYNVFIGQEAGMLNKIGQSNVYIGHSVSKIDTSGRYNVNIGRSAGVKLKDAHFNVLLGAQVAEYKPSGGNNVMIGKSAGAFNEGGAYNVIIGNQAGYNSQGSMFESHQLSYNVLIGSYAAISGIGSNNVVIGSNAGRDLKVDTSDYNVIIGSSAGYNAEGSKNIFIGNMAGFSEQGSERLYIENSNGLPENALIYGEFDNDILAFNAQIGIGTTNPVKPLHIEETSGTNFGAAIDIHSESGDSAGLRLRERDTDDYGFDIYHDGNKNKLVFEGIGQYGVSEGVFLTIARTDGTIIMPQVYSDIVGSTNRDLFIDDNGKIGYVSSSRKYKDNIRSMEDLSWFYQLNPVNFTYKKDNTKSKQYGLIAEEVENINPRFVSYNKEKEPETVLYSKFISVLIKTVQDQHQTIHDQEEKIEELEKRLQKIEAYLEDQ